MVFEHREKRVQERERSPEEITQAVREEIGRRVNDRFGDHPERGPDRTRFSFHGPEHPQEVLAHAKKIMAIAREHGVAGANDEAELAVDVGARAHDMVVRFREITDKSSPRYGEIDRYRGWADRAPAPIKDLLAQEGVSGNEQASWDELEKILDEHDPDKKIYTPRVRELARATIAATYPDAPFPFPVFPEGSTTIQGRDLVPYLFKTADGRPSGLKFSQPELDDKELTSPIAVTAVACGDLSYGGKMNAEGFQKHGDQEWAETHPLMVREIEAGIAQKTDAESAKEKARIAKSMIGWQGAQPGFLLWQKIRFENNINRYHNTRFSNAMHQEYNKFDDNILAAADRVDAFKNFSNLGNESFFTNSETADEANRLFSEMIQKVHVRA